MSVNIDELIDEIQTRGFNVGRVRLLVNNATAEQMNTVTSYAGDTVLFIIPRLAMILRSESQITELVDFVKIALERGANPDIRNNNGNTPLIAAVKFLMSRESVSRFISIIRAFVNGGADVDAVNNNGETVLYTVAAGDVTPQSQALVFAGVSTLIDDAGADPNLAPTSGLTPLMVLISRQFDPDYESRGIQAIRMLIRFPRTDLGRADNLGQTALMKAVIAGKGSVVQELLNYSVSRDIGLNEEDMRGNTALMLAAATRREDRDWIIEMLVNAGANKNYRNEGGQTAYDILKDNDPRSNVLSLLVDYAAEPDVRGAARAVSYTRPESSVMAGPPRSIVMPINNIANPADTASPASTVDGDDSDVGDGGVVGDDEGWITARPLPPPIQTTPAPTTGQRRRLPWEVAPYESRASTGTRRRRRDEDADEEEEAGTGSQRQVRRDIKINVNQAIDWFDPIMQEEEKGVVIKERLAENPRNVLIVYGNNMDKYFFTDRNVIGLQGPDATFYPCKKVDTMKPTNILRNKPLYDLKMIGLIEGAFCDMSALGKKPEHQVFAIVDTGKKYPSFVSDAVLNRGASFVSGLHCQAGQERRVSELVAATPVDESLGGRRRARRTRRNSGKAMRGGKRRTHKKITVHGGKKAAKVVKTNGRKTRKMMRHKKVHRKWYQTGASNYSVKKFV